MLKGGIRISEDRVRINAQLIDATAGYHPWSERCGRDLKDIFALQDEFTLNITTAVQIKLSEEEHLWGGPIL